MFDYFSHVLRYHKSQSCVSSPVISFKLTRHLLKKNSRRLEVQFDFSFFVFEIAIEKKNSRFESLLTRHPDRPLAFAQVLRMSGMQHLYLPNYQKKQLTGLSVEPGSPA